MLSEKVKRALWYALQDAGYALKTVRDYGKPGNGPNQHYMAANNYEWAQSMARRNYPHQNNTMLGNAARAVLPLGYEAAKWAAMKGPESLRPTAKRGLMAAGQSLGPAFYNNRLGADEELWTIDESTSEPSLERAVAFLRGLTEGDN